LKTAASASTKFKSDSKVVGRATITKQGGHTTDQTFTPNIKLNAVALLGLEHKKRLTQLIAPIFHFRAFFKIS
jgi:hypothetical protein